jgi:hypothetical protein
VVTSTIQAEVKASLFFVITTAFVASIYCS